MTRPYVHRPSSPQPIRVDRTTRTLMPSFDSSPVGAIPPHRSIGMGRTWCVPTPSPEEYARAIELPGKHTDTVAAWVFSILLGLAGGLGLFFWLSR